MSTLLNALKKDYEEKKLAIIDDLEDLEKITDVKANEEAIRLIKDIKRNFKQLMKIAEPPQNAVD